MQKKTNLTILKIRNWTWRC